MFLGTRFSASAGLMVGLGDLAGLFQPKSFYDSFQHGAAPGVSSQEPPPQLPQCQTLPPEPPNITLRFIPFPPRDLKSHLQTVLTGEGSKTLLLKEGTAGTKTSIYWGRFAVCCEKIRPESISAALTRGAHCNQKAEPQTVNCSHWILTKFGRFERSDADDAHVLGARGSTQLPTWQIPVPCLTCSFVLPS